jgi:hypothetical protein
MPKKELEFFDPDMIPWKLVEGETRIYEKIVSHDSDTGSYTRILKFEPGLVTENVLVHDFWEEVYIIKGTLIDMTSNQTFIEGMYACRPPGMKHGPYSIPTGCVTFEIRTYEK